jgi:hypothetical protein
VGRTLGLVCKFITRTAHAGACRIAALNHEVGNHAVKNRAVVELAGALLVADGVGPLPFALGELHEVLYRLGRVLFKEAADDRAFAGVEDGISSRFTGHEDSWCGFSFELGTEAALVRLQALQKAEPRGEAATAALAHDGDLVERDRLERLVVRVRCTRAIDETTEMLAWSHCPKMVCFWSRCVVGTSVIKN